MSRLDTKSHILGISCFYHDSAACLLKDGRIIAAVQEERFSRKKHDPRFPLNAIDYCLAEARISVDDLDYVVYYDKPMLTFERLLMSYLSVAPKGLHSWLKSMPLWLGKKLHIPRVVKRETGYAGDVLFTEHHEAHAASAFYPSPYKEAAILTMDGVGEWATASFGYGQGKDITILKELHFPDSLGLLYSAFTYFAGFRVNSGEYKLMGLAPYGVPKYKDLILSELVDVKPDGSLRLNMAYFNFIGGLCMTHSNFSKLFDGPPRIPESEITRREMDMAASIQAVTEEVVLKMAHTVYRETGMLNLCLAGGVALNCVANSRLLRDSPFERIWIQPAAGDAGGALGAALRVWHRFLGHERNLPERHDSQKGSYLGPAFTDDAIRAFLDAHGYPYTRLTGANRALAIAEKVADEKVVGYMAGRMEFGPRALGARSILGDPRKSETQFVMNKKIKYRESFRPFAPSVLEEDVSAFFAFDMDSPYMLFVAKIIKDRQLSQSTAAQMFMRERLRIKRSDIPAVTHLDYTARLQTVNRDTNRGYHDLISAFKALTGYGILVNTSFNVRGEPIVCTPRDAYRCFMRTGMDVLVMEDCMLLKEEQPIWHETGDHVNESNRIDQADVRKFGMAASVFFGCLGISIWLKKPVAYLFGCLFFLGAGFLLLPVTFRRVYRVWMRLSHAVGLTITSAVLGLAFYGVITPAALLKRFFGGRPLPMKPDKDATTYWIKRSEPCQPRERFIKRY